MSIPVSTRPLGANSPLDADAYQAGVDDARDEHTAGTTVQVFVARLEWMTDPAHLNALDDSYTAYTLGYAAYVLTLRMTTTQPTTVHRTPYGAAA